MSLPYKLTPGALGICLVLLTACLGIAGPQSTTSAAVQVRTGSRQGVISQPSLGEIARVAMAERKQTGLKDVPLYTNDNLPKGGEGLSVIGPPILPGGGAESKSLASGRSPEAVKEIAYLRHKLSQAQVHLQLHQRELSVLKKQISQSQMQWYPNPSETLMQEYSRGNISNLSNEINSKKQQITQDQQEVESLNDQLERAQARLGWVNAVAQGSSSRSQTTVPPGVKPGTPEYWQARIQAAREQLATAKEEQGITKNELGLLKLQQLRSLDPNVQANLATNILAKQEELSAAVQAIERAQKKIETLERKDQKAAGSR